ncbi:helix-turn-helix domain-containing protein [Pseudoduganella sp. RAF53_2]|uniref:helix-turn-helix domain-containing protein n=1 Tax=unclassified Pseudoduganella TaxID=2637179 RepID=UPI003F96F511
MRYDKVATEKIVKAEPLDYDPCRLLDAMKEILRLKNDAALARTLKIKASTVSKIRHGRIGISAETLIRMNEVSGAPISDLKYLLGSRANAEDLTQER